MQYPVEKNSFSFGGSMQMNQSAASQRHRMALYLGCYGSISTFEARQELAIQQPAARKMELEKQGFMFETRKQTLTTAEGSTHNGVAVYHLIGFDPEKMTLSDFLRMTGRDNPLPHQFDQLRSDLQAVMVGAGVFDTLHGNKCLGDYWGFLTLQGERDGHSISVGWGLYPEKAEDGEEPVYREDMLTALNQIKRAIKRFIGTFEDGSVLQMDDDLKANYCFWLHIQHDGLSGSMQFDFPSKGGKHAA